MQSVVFLSKVLYLYEILYLCKVLYLYEILYVCKVLYLYEIVFLWKVLYCRMQFAQRVKCCIAKRCICVKCCICMKFCICAKCCIAECSLHKGSNSSPSLARSILLLLPQISALNRFCLQLPKSTSFCYLTLFFLFFYLFQRHHKM